VARGRVKTYSSVSQCGVIKPDRIAGKREPVVFFRSAAVEDDEVKDGDRVYYEIDKTSERGPLAKRIMKLNKDGNWP
jgi:cold shock CspA family protein